MKKFVIIFIVLPLLGGCTGNSLSIEAEEASDSRPAAADVITDQAEILETSPAESTKNLDIEKLGRLASGTISAADWQSHDGTPFPFTVKFPPKWVVEDFSTTEDQLRLGFYSPGNDRGYEYTGDVTLYTIKRQAGVGVVDYFDVNYLISPEVTERKTVARTESGSVVVASYDIPGNIDFDVFLIECDDYFIGINVPFGQERETARIMADQVVCD